MADEQIPLPEVGSVVHLEHFNFTVSEQDLVTLFFMGGLGLTRDPYQRTDETNIGVNIGLQQFHLPRKGKTPPFTGEIGLVVPDMPVTKIRLDRLEAQGKFAGTPYTFERQGATALITSPFGIRLRLHHPETLPFLRPLGLVYVEFIVPMGLTENLARFYQEIMNCPLTFTKMDGETTLIVTMGAHQFVRFRERKIDDYQLYNFHIAFYTTHYNQLKQTMIERGSFLGEGRNQTFFFDKLFHPDSGDHFFTLQHEARSLYHPDFMRPLVNRWPLVWEPHSDHAEIAASLRP